MQDVRKENSNFLNISKVVLVHPHFDPAALDQISFLPDAKISLENPVLEEFEQVTFGSALALRLIARNQALLKFYQGVIDRINSNNHDSQLIIMRAVYDHEDDRSNDNEWSDVKEIAGLPDDDEYLVFHAKISEFQPQLIRYASEKFAERLQVTDVDPDDICDIATRFFCDGPNADVYIFGEALEECVAAAAIALNGKYCVTILTDSCP